MGINSGLVIIVLARCFHGNMPVNIEAVAGVV